MRISWWLDHSALPDLIWARLSVHRDETAEILTMDGHYVQVKSKEEAYLWLREDEYDDLEILQEGGEVETDLTPPVAPSDAELIRLMHVYRDGH